ncbi:MAG: hypothetical protein HYY06_18305 [Deltaproteobacteria bacterium]|nr:hypothetical protein [Deltaproteobacteria bacterium]
MVDTTVHVMRQLDVADSIDLEKLDGARSAAGLERLSDPALPAGLVPVRQPLDLGLGRFDVGPFSTEARLRVFDFGVAAIRFTFNVPDSSASALAQLSLDLQSHSASFDLAARRVWGEIERKARPALRPGDELLCRTLIEDFTVFVLSARLDDRSAEEIFAHVLLGEPLSRRLAASLVHRIANHAIQYYEDDLVLLARDVALVVEPGGAEDLVDVFEVASAQLLEYRFYDALLARAHGELARDAAQANTTGWIFRSPFAPLARRAAIMALEVGEMTDRLEGAITLVGDSYTVKVYREVAKSFRLERAAAAIRDKIDILASVSEALGSQVHSRRSLLLEVMVIALIAIEVFGALR